MHGNKMPSFEVFVIDLYKIMSVLSLVILEVRSCYVSSSSAAENLFVNSLVLQFFT